MNLEFVHGDDGRAYYVKGHVPIDEFMAAVRLDLGDDKDTMLSETATHCWMRIGRDFQEGHSIITEAVPNSRGAFRATWIQDA